MVCAVSLQGADLGPGGGPGHCPTGSWPFWASIDSSGPWEGLCWRYDGHAKSQGGRQPQAHLGPHSSMTEEVTALGTVLQLLPHPEAAASPVQPRSRALAGMVPQQQSGVICVGHFRPPASRGGARHPLPEPSLRLRAWCIWRSQQQRSPSMSGDPC